MGPSLTLNNLSNGRVIDIVNRGQTFVGHGSIPIPRAYLKDGGFSEFCSGCAFASCDGIPESLGFRPCAAPVPGSGSAFVIPISHVVGVCAEEKMQRIYAQRPIASMQYLQVSRYIAVGQFPSQAMGTNARTPPPGNPISHAGLTPRSALPNKTISIPNGPLQPKVFLRRVGEWYRFASHIVQVPILNSLVRPIQALSRLLGPPSFYHAFNHCWNLDGHARNYSHGRWNSCSGD
jgi:hypothetical protein